MSSAMLSTEQAPPISVPLRFFAIAPLFLVLAAAILATGSNDATVLLAATHCLTLGFITMVMAGAMQQILPVVIGSPMPASKWIAWLTLLPMSTGTLSLVGGFLYSNPALLYTACWLLGCGFFIFISACLISIYRAAARNPTKLALLLAILALTITATLGIVLASGYASGTALDYPKLAASHISMGLGGWVMLLVAGVSYQVVPMFQLTPNYPQRLSTGFAPALFTVLLLSLVARGYDIASLSAISTGLFWVLTVSFAVITLRLQNQRRRRVADATLSFFRLGMSGLLCAALFSTLALFPPLQEILTTLSVVIFITGFAMPVIFGMLYKIVPFLVWFHLFRGGVKKGVPNMKSIIPEVWMWRHLQLHRFTLLALLTASVWNPVRWLAITGLALQGVLLCYALYTAITVYQRTLKKLETT
jgi:hypothetical protein